MMNPNLTLDDLQWQTLIRQTAGYFSDLTIKRGFQYYKQGRVHASEKADASGVIEASVDGTETYRIRLQLHSLSDSECSCPVNGGCKHMVAVLLDYAQLQGRSIHALVNAHSTTYAASSSYDRSDSGLSQGHERPPAGFRNGESRPTICPSCRSPHGMSCSRFARLRWELIRRIRFTPKTRWLHSITLNRRCRRIWIRYTSSMPISSFSRSWSSSQPVLGIPQALTSAIIRRWRRIISWPESSESFMKGWRATSPKRHSDSG